MLKSVALQQKTGANMLDLERLISLSDDELASHDIAEVNLACAEGLPGAEDLDVPACLSTVNKWTNIIGCETARLSHRFQQKPEAFGNSLARFRLLVLMTVLQRDFGVWTNTKLNDVDDLPDSRDLFIHGPLRGIGGACSSLPVLVVAIGRRLGYPLKLVSTACHLFARWDDPAGERLEIECTSRGFDSPPTEYYLTWPRVLQPYDLQGTHFLKSQSPREELAGFLIQRGYCLLDNKRYREAVESCIRSHRIDPHHRLHARTVRHLLDQWRTKLFHMPASPGFDFSSCFLRPQRTDFAMEREELAMVENLWEREIRGPWGGVPSFASSDAVARQLY